MNTRSLPVGVFSSFLEDDYHADSGLGSGSIKHLSESPAAYAASKLFPFEGNDSTDFGSAFHMRVLQPERYAKVVVELENDVSFATKEGKELKRALSESRGVEADKLIFLKRDKVLVLKEMLARIEELPALMGINPFESTQGSEVAFFWHDENEIRGKALVDKYLPKYNLLVDIKTTRGPLDDRCALRTAVDYNWPLQAAWYRRGVSITTQNHEPCNFIFIAVQTTAPFSIKVMPVPHETIEQANILIAKALVNYAEYRNNVKEKARHRDVNSGVLNITYPDWVVNNINKEV